jgi:hypothetical protein
MTTIAERRDALLRETVDDDAIRFWVVQRVDARVFTCVSWTARVENIRT